MPRTKCAVIGTGNMGKNHVRTYSEIPEAELVAVVDLNEKCAFDLANAHGAKCYTDFVEMVEKEKPEVVSVCVPTAFHFSVAKKCLELGVNVLLEKPITLTVADGEKLIRIAQEKKIGLFVGHIERFNPAVVKVKEMIDKGELGKIITIMARRVGGFPPQIKDANIAVDLAIHDVDIVNYLLGELPKEVDVNKQRNHIEHREDSVEFFLKYREASAYIQANWITPVKIRKLNITGTEGYLEMDYINQKIEFYKSNYEKFRESSGNFSDYILKFSEPDKIDISVAKKEPLKEEIIHFINGVRSKSKFDCKFALDALKITLKE